MSFDFAVNDGGSTETTTNDDVSPDFESNEVGDIYLSAGDWKAILGAMLPNISVPEGASYTETLDDGTEVLSTLKIYGDDTLEDVAPLLEDYSDAHPQQKLHMVASLLKSTAGKAQRDNDHAIGLVDGEAPESHDEVQQDFSYALAFSDLPSINWDDLDGGERENLEELGVDPSEVGFDSSHGGPKLLVIDGQRLPIAVEEGSEIQETLELLQQLPDEPSTWTEDGYVESSDPSVFDSSDTENAAEDSSDGDVADYVNNPELVGEVNASVLRSGEDSVRQIDSLRTINTLLSKENEGKERSTVIEALEERRSTLQGEDDEEDEADDDMTLEDIRRVYGFSDLEMDGVQHRVESGKADDFEEAAEQVAS